MVSRVQNFLFHSVKSKTSVVFSTAIAFPSPTSLNATIVKSLIRPYFKLHILFWKPILGHYVSSFCYSNLIFGMDSAMKTSLLLSETILTNTVLLFKAQNINFHITYRVEQCQ